MKDLFICCMITEKGLTNSKNYQELMGSKSLKYIKNFNFNFKMVSES